MAKEKMQEKIDEIIEIVKADGHYVIGDYEIYLIHSTRYPLFGIISSNQKTNSSLPLTKLNNQ